MTASPDNRYRLRQLALVARELAPVEEALLGVFGLKVAHRDPAVAKFGLENIVVPVGDQFIEIVAPIEPGTTAERYLDRRGGDGGYMVILQCTDPKGRNARAEELGIREVFRIDRADYDGLQLHPRDTGGSFLEIDYTDGFDEPDSPWYPAGKGWQSAKSTAVVSGLAAAVLQSPEPRALAQRWAAILDHPLREDAGAFTLKLAQGEIRFTQQADSRGEGLSGIDIKVNDRAHVQREAAARGLVIENSQLSLCGVRFNLTS
ncbi:MAG: VOC family protein [Alphaproteobacteria bacterium]|nr:VOC family protein [Alphaproteobacteria bacterium]